MTDPTVSVVIPTFNRADTLPAAIRSALCQSFSGIEVIVVDDGSRDETAAVLAIVADSRLRILRHETNRGAAAARNTGIRAARGRLIAFLDSDDTWMPDKLALQVPVLDAAPDTSSVSCTGVMLHLLDHGITRERRIPTQANWAHLIAVGCDLSPGSTQLTRREEFDRVGLLDENLPRFEDWDWLFRYSRDRNIAALSSPLAHVYNRRGRLGEELEVSTERFLTKHSAAMNALPRKLRNTAMTDAWLQVVAAYGFEGRIGSAIRPFLRAFQRQPLKCLFRGARGLFYVVRGRLLGGRRT